MTFLLYARDILDVPINKNILIVVGLGFSIFVECIKLSNYQLKQLTKH